MALYTPFVERNVDKLAAGYQQAEQSKLAQSAYMGDSEALGQLYGSNPQLAEQIKRSKLQEQQNQIALQGKQQQVTKQTQEIARQIAKDTANMSYEEALSYSTQQAQAYGLQLPPMTREQHAQFKKAFGSKAEIGKYNPRDYTVESFAKFQETGDPSVLERYESQKNIEIGGVPHRFDPARGGYFPAEVAGADDTASPVTTETVADSEAKIAGSKEVSKLSAKDLFERRGKAVDAAGSLRGIQEARKLLDSGMITGFGANFKVGLGKALQSIGVNVAEDPVANTEAFTASMAQQVASIIKQFGAGTGLSDADREFATKAAGGEITMNEESIRRILEINERAIRNVVGVYNKDASQVPEGLSPFSLTIDLDDYAPPEEEADGWSIEEVK